MKDLPYEIIGARFGLACPHEAVAHGPEALRQAGLLDALGELGVKVEDGGDVLAPQREQNRTHPKLNNFQEAISFCNDLSARVMSSWRSGKRPVVIGGDHSISMATIGATSEHIREQHGDGAEIGVLWVDAHADLNTADTSPSGNIHGLPVAALLGIADEKLCQIAGPRIGKIKPENVAYIGLRDLDPVEKVRLKEMNITAFSMKEIDQLGMNEVCSRAFQTVSDGTHGFVMSYDLDVCDPALAPGVGTPVRGGLTYREAHLVMELVAEQENFLSFDFVELNPSLDSGDASCELAKALLLSAFGKTIL